MATTMLRRARPGRAGSIGSARKALWEAIFAARTVLETADDQPTILAACQVLVAAVTAYVQLLDTPEAARAVA